MIVRGCSPLHFSFGECKVHTIYMALIHVHTIGLLRLKSETEIQQKLVKVENMQHEREKGEPHLRNSRFCNAESNLWRQIKQCYKNAHA